MTVSRNDKREWWQELIVDKQSKKDRQSISADTRDSFLRVYDSAATNIRKYLKAIAGVVSSIRVRK